MQSRGYLSGVDEHGVLVLAPQGKLQGKNSRLIMFLFFVSSSFTIYLIWSGVLLWNGSATLCLIYLYLLFLLLLAGDSRDWRSCGYYLCGDRHQHHQARRQVQTTGEFHARTLFFVSSCIFRLSYSEQHGCFNFCELMELFSFPRVLHSPSKLSALICLQQRRRMCLSRFWQLDDDGVYLVTYSSVKDEAYPPSVTVRACVCVLCIVFYVWTYCQSLADFSIVQLNVIL